MEIRLPYSQPTHISVARELLIKSQQSVCNCHCANSRNTFHVSSPFLQVLCGSVQRLDEKQSNDKIKYLTNHCF